MNRERATHYKRLAGSAILGGLVIFSLFTAIFQPGAHSRRSGTLLATQAWAEEVHPVKSTPTAAGKAPGLKLGNEESSATQPIFSLDDAQALLAEKLKRKEQELDAREQALKKKEEYLETLRKETAANLAKVEALYNKLAQQSVQAQQKREKDLAKWRSIYQAMAPEKAGPIISGLETDFALELLSQMEPMKAAKILAAVEPQKAVELAKKLGDKKR
jgi:flagellar motility protein MotE (MotC chaperone)